MCAMSAAEIRHLCLLPKTEGEYSQHLQPDPVTVSILLCFQA